VLSCLDYAGELIGGIAVVNRIAVMRAGYVFLLVMLLSSTFALSAGSATAAHNSKGYKITVIPMPDEIRGATSSSVNNRGQVAGSFVRADYIGRGFLWSFGSLTVIDPLPGFDHSGAVDVNDFAVVVGNSSPMAGGRSRAFLWMANSELLDLGTLGGDMSEARAINNRGEVVGVSTTTEGQRHAFLWTEAHGMIDLGTGEGDTSEAVEINDRGQIVGTWRGSRTERAFRWQNGRMTTLQLPTGFGASRAYGVDERGQVVGLLWGGDISGEPYYPGFRYDRNGMHVLPTWEGPCYGQYTIPYDLNTRGEVVGQIWNCNGSEVGGVLHHGTWSVLGPYGGNRNIYMYYAYEINEKGQIVGPAEGRDLRPVAVLLTPRDIRP
jgi:probable HAF family extracellular repeat protein